MTTIKVVVDRDSDGRLHGTIVRDPPDTPAVSFTGVIEMVARIEEALDQPPEANGPTTGHEPSSRPAPPAQP